MSRLLRFGHGASASVVGLLLLTGCIEWRHKPTATSAPPTQRTMPAAVMAPDVSAPDISSTRPEAPEPVVDLEMVDAPVKLILQRLADIGGLQLILPPNLNKTISVQYIHVPVSIALSDVLKRADLRLGAGSAPNLPFDTVTVFYRLPANVDSMSADAIMRRFGVTKAVAELIVKSRRP